MPSATPPFRFWNFFFSLKGRVSRRAMWWFVLPLELALYSGGYALTLIHPSRFDGESMIHSAWLICAMILSASNFILLWPFFAVLFKRLHDRRLSGLIALPYFSTIIGSLLPIFILRATHDSAPRFAFVTLPHYISNGGSIFTLLLAVLLAILPGVRGQNRYGTDPRVATSPTDVF